MVVVVVMVELSPHRSLSFPTVNTKHKCEGRLMSIMFLLRASLEALRKGVN